MWILPFKQISDEQEGKGVGDNDVKMGGFGIDPTLPVFQVSPRQVDGQPNSVPPEPFIQRVEHPSSQNLGPFIVQYKEKKQV